MATPPPPPTPPIGAPAASTAGRCALLSCGCAALLVVLAVLAVVLGWKPFVRHGIASDLAGHAESVRHSDLAEAERDRVVAWIESLRARVLRDELEPGFMRWVEHDTRLTGILRDRRIGPEELARLEAELELIARAGAP